MIHTKIKPKKPQNSNHSNQSNQSNQFIQNNSSQNSSDDQQPLDQSTSHSTPRTKMLTFIDSLYGKFKLLNKLSQDESNNFQTEIITMLIDQNQCVDSQLYEETVERIGLETFVLEVLGTVVQKRNKFKNQYEMNRNLQEIAKELEKQRLQLTNKNKLIDKRELAIKKKQSQLVKLITEKCTEIEQNIKNNILNAEQQAKKRIKTVLTSLKSKQKQLIDKAAAFKQSISKLNDLQAKQKGIEEKLKQLDKKQKQRKFRETAEKQQQQALQQSNKKITQTKNLVISLEQTNKKLEEEVVRLGKKLKTNQMAYRHLKDQTDKKLAKCNEASEKVLLLNEENQRIVQEFESCKGSLQAVKKELSLKQNQIQRLHKQLKTLERSVKQQPSQKKDQLTTKITHQQRKNLKTSPESKPQCLIFDNLDISKIQDPFTHQQNQRQLMQTDRSPFDQRQDESIIDHVAESFMVMEKRGIDHELNEMSRTVDIQKQVTDWDRLNSSALERNSQGQSSESDQEQQQEDDLERERKYVMNMKKNSNPIQQKSSAKNNTLGKPNYHKPSQQTQKKPTKQSFKQKVAQLNRQHQSSEDQPQPVPQRYELSQMASSIYLDQSSCTKHQNIALFDNYFSSTPNAQVLIKSPHDQLLVQINDFLSIHEGKDSCVQLKSFTQETLRSFIKRISSPQIKHPRTLVEPFLDLLLIALQPCNCASHQQSLSHLFSHQLIAFLQQILLKFQAIIKDIEQKSIIILSRILLSYENQSQPTIDIKFRLKDKYLKSLKVKLLLEKDQFIRSNIRFLMEYQ